MWAKISEDCLNNGANEANSIAMVIKNNNNNNNDKAVLQPLAGAGLVIKG